MLDRIFKILSAEWLIHQDAAISYLPVLIALVKGQDILLKASGEDTPYVVAFSDLVQPVHTVGKWRFDDSSIPENSVAVLPVDGPITSWRSMELATFLRTADANPQINSVMLLVNSPGGMTTGLELLTATVKNMTKPTVSAITGIAASAAVWIISASDYRIATSRLDMIGSIGTKTSIQDYSGLLDKIGIKIHEFYATKSTRKEEHFRDFKATGDATKIIEVVDYVNEVFHEAIRTNLGIPESSEVFDGAIYFAEKAKELGLINEIGSLDGALVFAYKLGLKNKILTQSKSLKFNNQ